MSTGFSISLPATSANLGPGFDAAAVALDFALHVVARAADIFSISATGRNSGECARMENNLVLTVYSELLRRESRTVTPLALEMRNEIPLGMGCGSSAAGRLAGIAMANHFGGLNWPDERILQEACRLEGHPDNAAACLLGGLVMAAMEGSEVRWARVSPPAEWSALLVLPQEQLATTKARAVLPGMYSRADVVANIQSAGLLGLAFAQARADLLPRAMADRVHQPYRESICPLLPALLPLAGSRGVLGVALSGAGPSVLVICQRDAREAARRAVVDQLRNFTVELVDASFRVTGVTADVRA